MPLKPVQILSSQAISSLILPGILSVILSMILLKKTQRSINLSVNTADLK